MRRMNGPLSGGEVAQVQRSLLAAYVRRVGRADRNESDLGQDFLRGDVLAGRCGRQCTQPIPSGRQPAQVSRGCGGDAPAAARWATR